MSVHLPSLVARSRLRPPQPPVVSPRNRRPGRLWLWLLLSLLGSGLLMGLHGQQVFGSPYVIQDDARQHVFWLARLQDPDLFPGDWIADYFQSVAPVGYTWLYQMMVGLGVDPLWFNKWLPLVLVPLTTVYGFGVSWQLLPVPIAAFFATQILQLNLMLADDLYSGTPRAFVYPLFLAFLYYLLRRSRVCCVLAIVALGSVYPQMMLVACGVLVLRLGQWHRGRLTWHPDVSERWLAGLGLLAGGLMLLLYSTKSTTFGPVITAREAVTMPEFWADGRTRFFATNPLVFWLFGDRSGLLPRLDSLLKPPFMLLGLALPWLLRSPRRWPLVRLLSPQLGVLGQVLLVSLGLFFAAHALLFRLHHPSRYLYYSQRLVLALAAGLALAILLERCLHRLAQMGGRQWRQRLLLLVLVGGLLLYPLTATLAAPLPVLRLVGATQVLPGYRVGHATELYEFFARQPKASLIASLAGQADNLPTFAQRSVLVAKEYGIPFHKGYYQEFRDRFRHLLQAQYSRDRGTVQTFIQRYGVDFWLLDSTAFTPAYVAESQWFRQLAPERRAALHTLQHAEIPVVQQAIPHCTVFATSLHIVLDAPCVAQGIWHNEKQ